ncbi:MAG: hypothetical protein ACI3ZJ_02655 [Bacteroidaceae bacterium]
MAKISIKSEKITPFGGIFHEREQFCGIIWALYVKKTFLLRGTQIASQTASFKKR